MTPPRGTIAAGTYQRVEVVSPEATPGTAAAPGGPDAADARAGYQVPGHRDTPRIDEVPRGTVTLSGEVVRRTERLPDGTRRMNSFLRIEEAQDSAGRLVQPLAGAEVQIVGENAAEAIRYDGEEVRATGELRDRDITRATIKRYELEMRQIQPSRVEVSELRYR